MDSGSSDQLPSDNRMVNFDQLCCTSDVTSSTLSVPVDIPDNRHDCAPSEPAESAVDGCIVYGTDFNQYRLGQWL